jgi:hypothetical protein
MNNKVFLRLHFSRLVVTAGASLIAMALSASLWAQANSRGEEFFMISSVDQQNHQIVLMRPTQLTVVADFGPQTLCLGDSGQKLTPKDLRAGDTVWAIIKPGKKGAEDALRIREGAMTQAELQQLYLHYTTTTPAEPPVAPKPLNPATESGSVQPQPSSGPSVAPATATPSDATLRRSHKPGHGHHHPQGATGAI